MYKCASLALIRHVICKVTTNLSYYINVAEEKVSHLLPKSSEVEVCMGNI